jgi:mannose-1-phosphate guanylyltransferase
MESAYAVIMAGGQGTRLWPLSREESPKQFLILQKDGQSLLQETFRRAADLVGTPERVLVVAVENQAGQVIEHLPGLAKKNLLLEPVGRNTAASIGLAATHLQEQSPHSVMVVLPCDHLYNDELAWATAIRKAVQFATNHPMLVTIGIPPTDASSNYGYIQVGECLDRSTNYQVYQVNQFIEKPTIERAGEFLQRSDYLWNTGTFAWRPEVYLAALEYHLPETHQVVSTKRQTSENFSDLYSSPDNISVDYGVMEQAENVAVVRGDFQRIDVGNLASLGDLWPRDEQGNAGFGDLLLRDSCDNLIYTDEGLVSLVGVRDLIVIRKGDIVLVCSSSQAAEVKEMLKDLEREGLRRYR